MNYRATNILAAAIMCCLVFAGASAQDKDSTPVRTGGFMFGAGNGQTNLSMSYQFAWRFGQRQRLRMGVGARFNLFTASDKFFVTAPAKIVQGETGPAALFNEPIKANMDSVQLAWARTASLNVLIQLTYDITHKLKAGFNIDVIGFSFGASSPGNYINGNASNGIYTKPVTASPSNFNLLLVGTNDLGSLNSEFFVTYALNEKWALKGGIQHVFVEYTTDTRVQQFPEPNDRFRITPTLACFGVVITIR